MKVLGPILTFLFAWIDSIVAKMITLVYNLLMNLSNLVLYSDSIVKTLGQRIGIILGIFMLFRLAVSLINYMISPEKFSDNKTGGAQLVKNIIISLVLLATINTIFETAYMVQKRIVESGIVQKIFFGDTSKTNPPSNEEGVDIGYYLYTGLFTPNEDVIPECKNMWDITTDLNEPTKKEEPDEYFEKSCDDVLFELTETNARNSIYEARNNLDMSKVFSNYDVVTANRDGAFTGTELFNYTPIVSTAVGVMAVLILISFSIELAIRAVKLLFLQIIAPVPIIANMDTGKGKDIFNKWLKQCINTYISVFIRLIAINFGVFMIVLVKGNFKDIFTGNVLLNIFVIIGCLMFAKQVPKLIEDMFGIKLDGMALHPLKNFKDNALFGSQITGLARGAAAGTIGIGAGAFGAAIASASLGNGLMKSGFSALRGGLRGAAGGIGAGYKSKNGLEAIKAGRGRWGSEADYVNSLDGTTLGGRMKAGLQQKLHIATAADEKKSEIEERKNISGQMNSILERAKAESVKNGNLGFSYEYTDHTGTTRTGLAGTVSSMRTKQAQLDVLKNDKFREKATGETDAAYNTAKAAWQKTQSERISDLNQEIMAMEKAAQLEYVSKVKQTSEKIKNGIALSPDDINDKEMIQRMSDLDTSIDKADSDWVKANVHKVTDGKTLKSERESLDVDTLRIEQSVEYKTDIKNAAATKPKGGK